VSHALLALMEAGSLAPLSYYFARFVARGCGEETDSLLGCSAALVSLRNLQGDVCVDLGSYAGRPLFEADEESRGEGPVGGPRGPALPDWLAALEAADWVGGPGDHAPLILEGRRLYLGKYWRFEQQVADALRARLYRLEELDLARLGQGLARLFPPGDGSSPDWQKVAAAVAASRRFAVISGGPGTGKTTTVVKVLALLLEQDLRLRIALAAPTGKAAARLTDALRGGKGRVDVALPILERIPEEAVTIHRLLGAGFGEAFRHDGANPLVVDCLVVDEASMIDLPLMARLLEALPGRARLILLGDRDQLASVEAGNVLGDITGRGREIRYSSEQTRFLAQVGAAPAAALPSGGAEAGAGDALGLLRVSYRFTGDSGIGALARAVNAGDGEAALGVIDGGVFDDLAWLPAGEGDLNPACLDWAVERYKAYLEQEDVAAALRLFERSRVLAALRRGPFGVDELNRLIEGRLRALGLVGDGEEYHGKPVMVTANDYEVGLFNGDIGLLWRDRNQVLRAFFRSADEEVRSVSVRQLPEHLCAYALTVHKSQGSELDEVLLVLPHDPSPVATRELIYTGITRARRQVTIQGCRETFRDGCRRRVERSSALAEKLGWAGDSPRES
jgi:exodeoxyribonuclease V alpha subunit